MKHFITCVVLILSVQSAFAQFHYGIKGGGSLVNMALEQFNITNEQYRLSYQAGLYGTQSVSKRVFSRVELLYANKGFRAEAPSVVVGVSPNAFAMHLHYLSLPALAGYAPTERFFVLLGPEISYLVAARSKFGSESNDASAAWNERLDIGVAAGMGYFIGQKVNIELRYIHGLRDVAPNDYQWADPQDPLIGTIDFQSQNRVVQLSLAYQIN